MHASGCHDWGTDRHQLHYSVVAAASAAAAAPTRLQSFFPFFFPFFFFVFAGAALSCGERCSPSAWARRSSRPRLCQDSQRCPAASCDATSPTSIHSYGDKLPCCPALLWSRPRPVAWPHPTVDAADAAPPRPSGITTPPPGRSAAIPIPAAYKTCLPVTCEAGGLLALMLC